jgi:hypothetical protein
MINLKSFCLAGHHITSEPWSCGEYSFASDGEVLVRVPRIDGFEEFNRNPDWILPTFKLPISSPEASIPEELLAMRKCEGCTDGRKPIPCEECEGKGQVYAHTDHNRYDVECMSCEGGKVIPESMVCDRCEGTGKVRCNSNVKIGELFYSATSLAKIVSLPSLRFFQGNERAARFEFDGGDGLIAGSRMDC